MAGNLAISLRRRHRPCSIEQYDRLPPELRNWLAQAALPWSPVSALRVWTRAMRESAGDTDAVLRRLELIEARMLMKDAPQIWGFPPKATAR